MLISLRRDSLRSLRGIFGRRTCQFYDVQIYVATPFYPRRLRTASRIEHGWNTIATFVIVFSGISHLSWLTVELRVFNGWRPGVASREPPAWVSERNVLQHFATLFETIRTRPPSSWRAVPLRPPPVREPPLCVRSSYRRFSRQPSAVVRSSLIHRCSPRPPGEGRGGGRRVRALFHPLYSVVIFCQQ